MYLTKKILLILGILIILVLIIFGWFFSAASVSNKPFISPFPNPTTIQSGEKIKIKYPQDYTIILVGDSMTEVLGNSDELRKYLKEY